MSRFPSITRFHSVIVIVVLLLPFIGDSCGNVPSSCANDLSWAVKTGKKWHKQYYPNFESVTGTALSAATEDDMVTYWVCTGQNPNGNCDGLELPCSRSCSTDSQALSVVTQNLKWYDLFQKRGGGNFYNVFKEKGPYDLFFFQECDNVNTVARGLGYDVTTYRPVSAHSVAMMWSNSRFKKLESNWQNVGEDRWDQWYGKRAVVWARLQDKLTNKVVFAVSHHGPLPINTGGKADDDGADVAKQINAVIDKYSHSGDTVIMGGDFNADDGSGTVKALTGTYGFNLRKSKWVDHIFTKGSALDDTPQSTIIYGTGSDHDGIKLTWNGGLSGAASSWPMFDGWFGSEYTLQLTMKDLMVIGLLVLNMILMTVFVVKCKKQSGGVYSKYAPVVKFEDSDVEMSEM